MSSASQISSLVSRIQLCDPSAKTWNDVATLVAQLAAMQAVGTGSRPSSNSAIIGRAKTRLTLWESSKDIVGRSIVEKAKLNVLLRLLEASHHHRRKSNSSEQYESFVDDATSILAKVTVNVEALQLSDIPLLVAVTTESLREAAARRYSSSISLSMPSSALHSSLEIFENLFMHAEKLNAEAIVHAICDSEFLKALLVTIGLRSGMPGSLYFPGFELTEVDVNVQNQVLEVLCRLCAIEDFYVSWKDGVDPEIWKGLESTLHQRLLTTQMIPGQLKQTLIRIFNDVQRLKP